MLTTILFALMVTVFLTYVIYVVSKYGIQTSISESYYTLMKNGDNPWYFIAFCWLFAFPAMILGGSTLMLFAGGGIVLVGAAAAMHYNPTRFWHMFGAIGGMVLGAIAIIFQYHLWYLTAGAALATLLAYIFDRKNWFFWAELSIFTAFTIAVGINKFSN